MSSSLNTENTMNILKLHDNAVWNVKEKGNAGYDISSDIDITIKARHRSLISTGISIEFPEGIYAQILPRSGIAVKNGIHVGAGVIDSSYRGEIKVLLFNFSDKDFEISAGDRIAQLIIRKEVVVSCKMVKTIGTTTRGTSGFGSSGMKVLETAQNADFFAE